MRRRASEGAGIHNILTKSLGLPNPVNLVKATMQGLRSLRILRVLRPLRLVARNPGMRLIITSL